MNDNNTKSFPRQLARSGWIAGIIAIALVALTAGSSGRVVGELIAFIFIGAGMLASIVSLATVPKFGSKNLLWPALVGIMINGLLLSIAVPNFLHARQRAMQQKQESTDSPRQPSQPAVTQQENAPAKQTGNWQKYHLANLEIMSPMELTKVDTDASFQRAQKYMQLTPEQKAAGEENAKKMEAYSGKQAGFAVSVNHRTLMADESITVEGVVGQIIQPMQQKFSEGFRSQSRDVVVDGIHATQLSLQFRIQGRTAKVENVVVLNPPDLWQIQTFGPADMAQYTETVEKILGSIKLLPIGSKPAP